jgi:flagellar hook assembly protein FlgD
MTFQIVQYSLRSQVGSASASSGVNHPKLERGQAKFTTELKSENSFESLIKEMDQNEQDTLTLLMEEMKQLPIDGEKGGSNNLSTILAQFQATRATGLLAKTIGSAMAKLEESAKAQQASAMVGKTAFTDNSNKTFTGGEVVYNFYINGKDLPQDATIHGVVIIKDEDGEEIYRKNLEKPLAGENSFNWLGDTKSKKTAAHGNYKIEVQAYYTVKGSNTQHKIDDVNYSKEEGKITRVDIKTGEIFVGNKKIDRQNLSLGENSKEIEDADSSIPTEPIQYLGKTVSIKNDEAKFQGEKTTIVPFFGNENIKDATIQVHFSQNGKFISMAQGKMDIAEGENNFKWNGKLTTDIGDIQNLISGKETFGSVPKGSYSYEVWVSTEDEPKAWKLEDTKLVHIDGIEYENGKTYATSGKERYNVESIRSIKETQTKPSLETLQKEAASLQGKRAKIADDIVEYQGRPAQIDFKVRPGAIDPDKKLGRIITTITNKKGEIVKTVIMEAADTQAEVNKYKTHYQLLTDASKGKIDWEIGGKDWIGKDGKKLFNYDLALGTHKDEIDLIIKTFPPEDLQLRPEILVPIPQNWDGKDTKDAMVTNGIYKFTMNWEVSDHHGVVETITEPSEIVLPVANTYIKDGDTILGFEGGRTVPLKDILAWA